MSDIAKERFKKKFIEWAKNKSLEEIADKSYEAMSTTYELTRKEMLEKTFEHFVKPVLEKE